MKVVTWNVNSINMRKDHVLKLMSEVSPDLILLQELKCQTQSFPSTAFEEMGYKCYVNGQKTHNGVAILSKQECEVVRSDLEGFTEAEARYLEVRSGGVRIIDVYVPFGQDITDEKFQKKIRFLSHLEKYLSELLFAEEAVIIGGDFNVAIEPIDTYVPLDDSVCYAIAVRKIIRSILHMGYFDVFRTLNPELCQFSWWDYRARCFERNMGMRLDYFLVSPKAMDRSERCEILGSYRALEKASDHVPVVLRVAP